MAVPCGLIRLVVGLTFHFWNEADFVVGKHQSSLEADAHDYFNQRQPWLLIARMTLVERKRRMGLGRVARQHMHGNSALRRRLVLRKQPREPKSPAELRPGTPTHQASTAAPVHVMTACARFYAWVFFFPNWCWLAPRSKAFMTVCRACQLAFYFATKTTRELYPGLI